MQNITCVILAAGRGTRMKSDFPKPLHKVHDRPMLEYLLSTVYSIGISRTVLVLGHGRDEIKGHFKGVDIIVQKKQLGSGDAVNTARQYFKRYRGDILVLYADTPLLKQETLKKLIEKHRKGNYGVTLLSVKVPEPAGYGRIIRDPQGNVIRIVEEKDATLYEKEICEINIGAYVFKRNALFDHINSVCFNRSKKEYYLTDIINIFNIAGIPIGALVIDDPEEGLGINSRVELAGANEIIRRRILEQFMLAGVTVIDPQTTSIDRSARIGRDTIIYPHTVIERDVVVGRYCQIGPFAHLRPGTEIAEHVEIGNYVELVRTKIGRYCKVKHKTYLGDTTLGEHINIGAGTITANYDGKNKNKTMIGDGAFIGVGCILIAPVRIGKRAVLGAGSVVTKNHHVPDGATVVGIPAKIFKKGGRA
ncbi:MAG: NTP transferase domain-containing protein [Candidatus Omnitrophica bacterium]|nr:NTP transferase domain-containing protein [Candidatus Omnitrophota bacterium]